MYLLLADSVGTVIINVSSGSRQSSGVSQSLTDLEFGAYLSKQKNETKIQDVPINMGI